MNYPADTLVQNYNVAAGRVIQLPCFLDQPEPPDGFRAVVFATPTIQTGIPPINQTGPDFAGLNDAAILFDLTQLIQQNALSRARSILVQTNAVSPAPVAAGAGMGVDLMLDSGLVIPLAGVSNTSESATLADFVSANPIFALHANKVWMENIVGTIQFSVCVANFKLSLAGFSSGTLGAAG